MCFSYTFFPFLRRSPDCSRPFITDNKGMWHLDSGHAKKKTRNIDRIIIMNLERSLWTHVNSNIINVGIPHSIEVLTEGWLHGRIVEMDIPCGVICRIDDVRRMRPIRVNTEPHRVCRSPWVRRVYEPLKQLLIETPGPQTWKNKAEFRSSSVAGKDVELSGNNAPRFLYPEIVLRCCIFVGWCTRPLCSQRPDCWGNGWREKVISVMSAICFVFAS